MRRTGNTSSLPRTREDQRLIVVPLGRLRPHPANANVMDERWLEKLAENIRREGDYPPLIVRPHPTERGCYELLDGHQRWPVLKRLGHKHARCYLWPCNDRTALVLLATLNRLEGRDDPLKRAELLRELSALGSFEELARLLPEDGSSIRQTLGLLHLNLDELLADLEREAAPGAGLRAITFAVAPEDEAVIERAVEEVAAGLEGANRRGRALGLIAHAYFKKGVE